MPANPNVVPIRTADAPIEERAGARDLPQASKPVRAKLSILIAAYNEQATLKRCLARVVSAPLPEGVDREVILVDDASDDRTWAIAQAIAVCHPQVRVFRQACNMGKGAAIRRAIREMTGDLAIIQDADLEYDPSDYSRILHPILSGRADVVFGSRFTGSERKVLYFWHTVGNRLLTLLSNMLNNINLTDMETCYKAFRADCLRAIPLESDRFGIEPELTAKVARNRFRIFEVPISYNGRTYEEGKKIGWKDGLATLWFILRYRLTPHYSDAGKVALDALEQAPRFNAWMFDALEPCLGRRVVELGAGRGNLSRHLLSGREVLLTDCRPEYLERLRELVDPHERAQVASLDLSDSAQFEVIGPYAPDTVVCLNVLEHIEHDQPVLERLFEVVPVTCRLVFLVPFNPRLFSEFDRQVGHFRRYDRKELEEKMERAGFQVERQFFFNKAGVLAWWVGNKLTGQRTITAWQLRIYNALTPLFRVLDRLLPGPGLSTVVVARKPE